MTELNRSEQIYTLQGFVSSVKLENKLGPDGPYIRVVIWTATASGNVAICPFRAETNGPIPPEILKVARRIKPGTAFVAKGYKALGTKYKTLLATSFVPATITKTSKPGAQVEVD